MDISGFFSKPSLSQHSYTLEEYAARSRSTVDEVLRDASKKKLKLSINKLITFSCYDTTLRGYRKVEPVVVRGKCTFSIKRLENQIVFMHPCDIRKIIKNNKVMVCRIEIFNNETRREKSPLFNLISSEKDYLEVDKNDISIHIRNIPKNAMFPEDKYLEDIERSISKRLFNDELNAAIDVYSLYWQLHMVTNLISNKKYSKKLRKKLKKESIKTKIEIKKYILEKIESFYGACCPYLKRSVSRLRNHKVARDQSLQDVGREVLRKFSGEFRQPTKNDVKEYLSLTSGCAMHSKAKVERIFYLSTPDFLNYSKPNDQSMKFNPAPTLKEVMAIPIGFMDLPKALQVALEVFTLNGKHLGQFETNQVEKYIDCRFNAGSGKLKTKKIAESVKKNR